MLFPLLLILGAQATSFRDIFAFRATRARARPQSGPRAAQSGSEPLQSRAVTIRYTP